ncbi:unnamed protein product [Toxocara canis]|uniref:Secreted protein n=1 Tax=Toxocara canis TaxID=6265 RepID=A0A183V5Q8_TOXCA|nr:unnamed protein product [Toxocara canis]
MQSNRRADDASELSLLLSTVYGVFALLCSLVSPGLLRPTSQREQQCSMPDARGILRERGEQGVPIVGDLLGPFFGKSNTSSEMVPVGTKFDRIRHQVTLQENKKTRLQKGLRCPRMIAYRFTAHNSRRDEYTAIMMPHVSRNYNEQL